jgi:DNA-binding Lrp family transcriptional regulator
MSTLTTKKNKITLSDYNYQKDIDNRLFMADLSVLEVDVLTEIINGSLKTMIDHLADDLGLPPKKLRKILEKLEKSHLFEIKGELIIVDKEMRKYYEVQMMKFDDEFVPDMEYLQGLLNKAPISALPNWYAIPRSSDHIFNSIVEKFLHTPKIYERYLEELDFENPVHGVIMKEAFNSKDYKIASTKLINKLKLTRQQFEEHMLFMEFNLVCCISYSKSDDIWEEVVTPFHEWREYCLFLRDTIPQPIKDIKKIDLAYKGEFGFLNELNAFLKSMDKKASQKIVDTALLLNLIQKDKQKLSATPLAAEWLNKPLADQAIILYRQLLNQLLCSDNEFTDKDFRETEKSLKRISGLGWVYYDDFIKGCLAAVGSNTAVSLKNKGKRWKYQTPVYQDHEKQFIETLVSDYLMRAGMIDLGTHNGKVCISLTAFGKISFY